MRKALLAIPLLAMLVLTGCPLDYVLAREKDATTGEFKPGTSMVEKVSQFASPITGLPWLTTIAGALATVYAAVRGKRQVLAEREVAAENRYLAETTMRSVETFTKDPAGEPVADALKDWLSHDHKAAGLEDSAQAICDAFGHSA